MKKIFLSLVLSLITTMVFGRQRDTVSYEHIRPYVYTFEVNEGKLSGPGAELLRKRFAQAQFVLLGERHNVKQISEFTQAIMAPLATAGYRYFAVETGPHSAAKLMELSKVPEKTVERLYQFNSRYVEAARFYPIPFFSGVEDARFLSEARRQGFMLWGIDQEFGAAPFFLLDDLLVKHKDSPNYKTIRRKHQQAKAFMEELVRKKDEEDYKKVYYDLLHSEEIKAFFATLDQSDPEVKAIQNALYESWEIYHNHRANIYKNLEARAALMKRYFSREYKAAQRKDENMPKVLIKMGDAHTQRGYTYNEVFDIGTFAQELAAFNGTKALNIYFTGRFIDFPWEKGDKLANLNSSRRIQRAPVLQAGRQDKWVVIDLQPLKEKMVKRELVMTKEFRKLIIQHDLLIIPNHYSLIEKNYAYKNRS